MCLQHMEALTHLFFANRCGNTRPLFFLNRRALCDLTDLNFHASACHCWLLLHRYLDECGKDFLPILYDIKRLNRRIRSVGISLCLRIKIPQN